MIDLLSNPPYSTSKAPWNKGKLVGQKPPLKLKEIWAIRIRLQILGRTCRWLPKPEAQIKYLEGFWSALSLRPT